MNKSCSSVKKHCHNQEKEASQPVDSVAGCNNCGSHGLHAKAKLAKQVILAYRGIQLARLDRTLLVGECEYSLSSRSGVPIQFPRLGLLIPITEIDIIIETSQGVYGADHRSCENCEKVLPVIYQYSRVPDRRPSGSWTKEYFVACPSCNIVRQIRTKRIFPADGM